MSEARKKLTEEDSLKHTKKETEIFLHSESVHMRLEELKRQEEKTKEEIKRKKEELRLKREEKLVKLKRDIRHMIDDENTGIGWYTLMIQEARELGSPWSLIHVKDLEIILTEERQHLARLKSMINY